MPVTPGRPPLPSVPRPRCADRCRSRRGRTRARHRCSLRRPGCLVPAASPARSGLRSARRARRCGGRSRSRCCPGTAGPAATTTAAARPGAPRAQRRDDDGKRERGEREFGCGGGQSADGVDHRVDGDDGQRRRHHPGQGRQLHDRRFRDADADRRSADADAATTAASAAGWAATSGRLTGVRSEAEGSASTTASATPSGGRGGRPSAAGFRRPGGRATGPDRAWSSRWACSMAVDLGEPGRHGGRRFARSRRHCLRTSDIGVDGCLLDDGVPRLADRSAGRLTVAAVTHRRRAIGHRRGGPGGEEDPVAGVAIPGVSPVAVVVGCGTDVGAALGRRLGRPVRHRSSPL